VRGAIDGGRADPGAGTVATPAATLRLLLKDMAALRFRHTGLISLVYVMAALQAIRYDEALFTLGVMLAVALALAVPAIEWRANTDRLLASLPVRRATLVRARYAAAGLAVALAWGVWVATGALLAPLLAAHRTPGDTWATAEGNAAFVTLCVSILAVILPLFFRLGLGRAATVFVPVAVTVYGLAALVARALHGGAGLVPPGALARSGLVALARTWGGPAAAAVTLLLLAGLVALSLGISIRAFRRRDL